MIDYAIVEVSGRQYKVTPDGDLKVDFLGDVKKFECDRVLLTSESDSIKLGTPYLEEKLIFDVLGSRKEKKIRVATYKAKANTRRIKGSRRMVTMIKLPINPL